jgi:predicted RNase H-like nuclease (RuvC/YqgF family)
VQNKSLSDTARKQLEQILNHKRQIAEAASFIQALETDIRELVNDQERIRQNLTSLNRVAGQQEQVSKYSRELAQQETRLATLRDSLAEQRRKKSALESELTPMIEKMEF